MFPESQTGSHTRLLTDQELRVAEAIARELEAESRIDRAVAGDDDDGPSGAAAGMAIVAIVGVVVGFLAGLAL